MNKSTKEDLKKLIEDNPELDIRFFTPNEGDWDYNYILRYNFNCYIDTLYHNDDKVYIGFDEALENFIDNYGCSWSINNEDGIMKELSDEELEKEATKEINKLDNEKVIIVSIHEH